VESLLIKDKIIKITVWNIAKINEKESTEEERDVQIDTLLKEFADVFSEELRPSSDHGTHNFHICTIAEVKPQI
jgi:hypothetical protein